MASHGHERACHLGLCLDQDYSVVLHTIHKIISTGQWENDVCVCQIAMFWGGGGCWEGNGDHDQISLNQTLF